MYVHHEHKCLPLEHPPPQSTPLPTVDKAHPCNIKHSILVFKCQVSPSKTAWQEIQEGIIEVEFSESRQLGQTFG